MNDNRDDQIVYIASMLRIIKHNKTLTRITKLNYKYQKNPYKEVKEYIEYETK